MASLATIARSLVRSVRAHFSRPLLDSDRRRGWRYAIRFWLPLANLVWLPLVLDLDGFSDPNVWMFACLGVLANRLTVPFVRDIEITVGELFFLAAFAVMAPGHAAAMLVIVAVALCVTY